MHGSEEPVGQPHANVLRGDLSEPRRPVAHAQFAAHSLPFPEPELRTVAAAQSLTRVTEAPPTASARSSFSPDGRIVFGTVTISRVGPTSSVRIYPPGSTTAVGYVDCPNQFTNSYTDLSCDADADATTAGGTYIIVMTATYQGLTILNQTQTVVVPPAPAPAPAGSASLPVM